MVLFSFFRFRMHGCVAAGQRTHCVSDAAGHLIPSLIHCLQTGGSPFPSLSNPKNPPGRAAYLQNSAGSVLIRRYRIILSADTVSEVQQMLSQKRRQYFVLQR